jgi:hypothetical protein
VIAHGKVGPGGQTIQAKKRVTISHLVFLSGSKDDTCNCRVGVVLDRRRRIVPEVVVVRRWAVGVLGIWKGGLGKGLGQREGQLTSNLGPRWTDPVTARRVPSK